jgi:hypothetical protein
VRKHCGEGNIAAKETLIGCAVRGMPARSVPVIKNNGLDHMDPA